MCRGMMMTTHCKNTVISYSIISVITNAAYSTGVCAVVVLCMAVRSAVDGMRVLYVVSGR